MALLIGVNPTQGHPVVGARIKQAAIKGLKLVTADPRRIELADYGQIHLGMRPGTNAALLNGLAHVVIRDGLVDERFVAERTEGYEAVAELVEAYTPEAVEEITSVPAADLVAAAHMYAEAERACILWGLGVTEHLYGSECVRMICNLALLTGNVGRPGAALLPLRGQNNVQGSSDHGALPDTFTDYRHVSDEAVASAFEERWGVKMKREPGMKIPEMFDAAVDGSLKAMYIFGEDVAQTDPNTDARGARARVARLPGLPGHLRERDDQVRGRDPAGVVVPREDRHVHQRRAPRPAGRGGQRPARLRQDGLRDPDDGVARARARDGLRDAQPT